ncbi:MAG: universal stress protein [Acidobacteriia bacterium]|nr:universal stress protein [Terriglobia bacterium]
MRILVAVDDSKFSEAAVQAAVSQYRPAEADVRVVHVLQPIAVSAPPQMSPGYAPELAAQAKDAEKLVERIVQRLRDAGFRVEGQVARGEIREAIVDMAKEWRADLIVLGSHGRTGVSRLLLGSVAEFVARHAPCSVEIVRVAASR